MSAGWTHDAASALEILRDCPPEHALEIGYVARHHPQPVIVKPEDMLGRLHLGQAEEASAAARAASSRLSSR